MTQATRKDSADPSGTVISCSQDSSAYPVFDLGTSDTITFTYDVQWSESEIRWASRWDNYLKMTGGQIHWFSILNSLMIMLFLSGMVAMILLRTLHRDIAKYNELASAEEAAEETGWKLVHGDVFREPPHSMVLVACVGSGVQLFGMALVTLVFAALGFLSPAHRGGLLQSTLLLFTFMGVPGGYSSARLYKLWQGEGWKEATVFTALLLPGTVFCIFFFLNLLIWGQASAGSVPFATMFALLVLWFGISVPLVFLGAYLGYRQPALEVPVRTNQMPREIPLQPWYMKPLFTSFMGGILPFGAVFTELFFIMSSIWHHQVYYMFGFLVIVFIILVITCAEISIALTYFQLTAEDYHWWWRSFLSSAFSGVYVLLYSWLYFTTRLQIEKAVSIILYFGYMLIMSLVFFATTGAIGLIATFFFVRAIYGSIKVD
jgi:transmembrane 9 superfamily protein 2/4